MKFLLLEDESLLRKNIAAYLRKKGFEVVEFDDGKTLLEKADIADFDAFILDINVPNFNGLEILEFIRNNDSKTPVVLISSYTDTKDVLNGFKLGCADYIKKPFDLLMFIYLTGIINIKRNLWRIRNDVTSNNSLNFCKPYLFINSTCSCSSCC